MSTDSKSLPPVTIVVMPKSREVTVSMRLTSAKAGVKLGGPVSIWPKFKFIGKDQEDAKILRGIDYRDKQAQAEDIINKACDYVADGGEVNLFIGPGTQVQKDPESGIWPSVPAHELLQELLAIVSNVYVAPGVELHDFDDETEHASTCQHHMGRPCNCGAEESPAIF
jgi:hypothetical protein